MHLIQNLIRLFSLFLNWFLNKQVSHFIGKIQVCAYTFGKIKPISFGTGIFNILNIKTKVLFIYNLMVETKQNYNNFLTLMKSKIVYRSNRKTNGIETRKKAVILK